MPARGRGRVQATADSKLAAARLRRGVTQQELATATGMSPATYWRLEHGQMPDPPLRLLANCALALGVELEDLIEGEGREWKVLDARYTEPPAPEGFWRSAE